MGILGGGRGVDAWRAKDAGFAGIGSNLSQNRRQDALRSSGQAGATGSRRDERADMGRSVLRPYMTVLAQQCRPRFVRIGGAIGKFVRCVLS